MWPSACTSLLSVEKKNVDFSSMKGLSKSGNNPIVKEWKDSSGTTAALSSQGDKKYLNCELGKWPRVHWVPGYPRSWIVMVPRWVDVWLPRAPPKCGWDRSALGSFPRAGSLPVLTACIPAHHQRFHLCRQVTFAEGGVPWTCRKPHSVVLKGIFRVGGVSWAQRAVLSAQHPDLTAGIQVGGTTLICNYGHIVSQNACALGDGCCQAPCSFPIAKPNTPSLSSLRSADPPGSRTPHPQMAPFLPCPSLFVLFPVPSLLPASYSFGPGAQSPLPTPTLPAINPHGAWPDSANHRKSSQLNLNLINNS